MATADVRETKKKSQIAAATVLNSQTAAEAKNRETHNKYITFLMHLFQRDRLQNYLAQLQSPVKKSASHLDAHLRHVIFKSVSLWF